MFKGMASNSNYSASKLGIFLGKTKTLVKNIIWCRIHISLEIIHTLILVLNMLHRRWFKLYFLFEKKLHFTENILYTRSAIDKKIPHK